MIPYFLILINNTNFLICSTSTTDNAYTHKTTMTSTHTGEAVVAVGEAVAELGGALRRDTEATVKGVRSITVGQMADSVVGAASGVLRGAVWVVQSLAFKKMEAPASAQASG